MELDMVVGGCTRASERSRNTPSVYKKIKAFVASIISTDGDAASYLSTSLLAGNLSGKPVENSQIPHYLVLRTF